jgi:sterol desaturase/sphingolipid hydroxylase (fatty acid hydroxylase superfamily)
MKMSKLGYFSEFLLFPPLIIVAMLLAYRSSIQPQPVIWATIYGIGLAGWTLVEYLLHRVLFHHAPILSRIHELHHNPHKTLSARPPG